MSFCKNCRPKIKALMKKMDSFLMDNIDKAFTLTGYVKKMLDLGVFDLAVLATTTKIDDKLLEESRNVVSSSMQLMSTYMNLPKRDTFGLLQAIAEHLANKSKEQQDAYLIKLASLFTKQQDRRYVTSFYDAAVQLNYTLTKVITI